MMKRNLIEDISTLTTVPAANINTLCSVAIASIAHDVFEEVSAGNSECVVSVGIGNIIIRVDDDCVRYRFEPNRNLDNSIKESISGKDSLSGKIEESFKEILMTTYKELF